MRCYFIVELDPVSRAVSVDTRLDTSARDGNSEALAGQMLEDWLKSVMGVAMKGDEDESVDIRRGKSENRKRFTFSYRRDRSLLKGHWDMSVPDEISFGTASEDWAKLFCTLALTFLQNPTVRPGAGCLRMFERRGLEYRPNDVWPGPDAIESGEQNPQPKTPTPHELATELQPDS